MSVSLGPAPRVGPIFFPQKPTVKTHSGEALDLKRVYAWLKSPEPRSAFKDAKYFANILNSPNTRLVTEEADDDLFKVVNAYWNSQSDAFATAELEGDAAKQHELLFHLVRAAGADTPASSKPLKAAFKEWLEAHDGKSDTTFDSITTGNTVPSAYNATFDADGQPTGKTVDLPEPDDSRLGQLLDMLKQQAGLVEELAALPVAQSDGAVFNLTSRIKRLSKRIEDNARVISEAYALLLANNRKIRQFIDSRKSKPLPEGSVAAQILKQTAQEE